ncbi:hypothetical protein JOF57_001630 [Mycolicibacterium lutetiense]|uniref:Uncharacterized protein n=1 Tax=Mycolicibacterium lutetiense TaxID=1641992 RepID=A0ABS4ZQG6_9MYCO|nr:hypothetical protein [Mycolicibacterium lutetiense]
MASAYRNLRTAYATACAGEAGATGARHRKFSIRPVP